MTALQRRPLDYRTFDALTADVALLRTHGYDRVGQWSLEQALEHLTLSMDAMQEGKPGMPRPLRLIFRPILRRMLRNRSLPALKATKQVQPAANVDAGVYDRFARAIAQAAAMTGTIIDHPAFGRITIDEWQQFQLLHASRHLSFLIPKTARA